MGSTMKVLTKAIADDLGCARSAVKPFKAALLEDLQRLMQAQQDAEISSSSDEDDREAEPPAVSPSKTDTARLDSDGDSDGGSDRASTKSVSPPRRRSTRARRVLHTTRSLRRQAEASSSASEGAPSSEDEFDAHEARVKRRRTRKKKATSRGRAGLGR